MKLLKKFFVFSAAVGILFFSGCSNFMNGSDLKKQIDETIADSEFYSIKRPAILNTNPMNGARNIARNSSVRVVFSDELNTAALDLDSSTIENISQENLIKAGDGTDHIVGCIKNGQKIFNKIKITIFSGTQELPAENYFNAPYVKRNYIELWPDTNNVIPANTEVKIEVSLDIKNKDGIEAGKPTDFYTWTYNYGDRIENISPVITALDTEFENPVKTYNFDSINAYLISTDDNNNDQYDVKLTIKSFDNDTGFSAGNKQTVIITEEVVSDFSIPLRNGEKSSSTFTPVINECAFGTIVTEAISYKLTNQNEGVYKISVTVLDDNGAASDSPEVLYLFKYNKIPDSTLALSNSTLTDEEYIVDSNDLPDEDSDDAYKQFILEKLWKKCLTFDINLTSPLIQIEGKSYDLDCTIESLTLECGDTLIAELSGDILNKYLDLENKKLNLTSYKKILEKVENDLILKFSVKDIFGKTNVVPFTVCRKNSIASLYANYDYVDVGGGEKEVESYLNIHLSDPRSTNLKVLYYPLDRPDDNNVDNYESFSYFKWKNSKTSKNFEEITNHIKDNIDYIGSKRYYTLRIFNQIKEKNIYGFPDSTDYNTRTPSSSVSAIFLPGEKTSVTPDGKNSNSYNVRLEINYKGYENNSNVKKYLMDPPDSALSLLMNDLAVLPKHDRDNKIIVIEYKVPPATTDLLGRFYLTYFSGLNDGQLYRIWEN